MTSTNGRQSSNRVIWILLSVLTLFVYFFGLTIPLVGPDEPRYAQVAREMFERADWITPTLGGHHWFEKPALLYWLQITSYHIFGVSEFAARFGSAIFGVGTIFSLWILGRLSVTQKEGQRPEAKDPIQKNDFANWLALIAASTIGIIVFSHGASFDIILTFPMTAALVSFYIFDSTERTTSATPRFRVYASLAAFYAFIGVSLIAKGLVGIVFPFAIVAFYFFLSWKLPNKTFILSLVWGTILAVAVASTWYMPMYVLHGYGFIDEFFVQHHFQRYTSNKYFHPQPFYFFFWVLPLMTLPWMPFFIAAIWDFGRRIFCHRVTENTGNLTSRLRISASPLLLFVAAWLIVPLVFFSFSGSKLPGYILPAVPAAIIFTAEYIWRFIQNSQRRSNLVQSTALATFVIIVIVFIFAAPRFADSDSVKSLIAAANENGMRDTKILSLNMISHNAEFYGSGRLLRTADGKQRKLLGPYDVLQEIERQNGKPVLVLVPLEYLRQLTEYEHLRTRVLKDNGEVAIAQVFAN